MATRSCGWDLRFKDGLSKGDIEASLYNRWAAKRRQAKYCNGLQRKNGTKTKYEIEQRALEQQMDMAIQNALTTRMSNNIDSVKTTGEDSNTRIQRLEARIDEIHDAICAAARSSMDALPQNRSDSNEEARKLRLQIRLKQERLNLVRDNGRIQLAAELNQEVHPTTKILTRIKVKYDKSSIQVPVMGGDTVDSLYAKVRVLIDMPGTTKFDLVFGERCLDGPRLLAVYHITHMATIVVEVTDREFKLTMTRRGHSPFEDIVRSSFTIGWIRELCSRNFDCDPENLRLKNGRVELDDDYETLPDYNVQKAIQIYVQKPKGK